MDLLTGLAIFLLGCGAGVAFAPPRARRRGFNPEEDRRILALEALVEEDPEVEDPAPRIELARMRLRGHDAPGAAEYLGGVLDRHVSRAPVREAARDVLRALLLHEIDEGAAAPGRLLPQDLDWHPESKRMVMRLRDLTLGGVLEICELELHLDDFEPAVKVQPLPRVVYCRARLREDRLALAIDSRIDWTRAPLGSLRIELRDGRMSIRGSYLAAGIPIGFRVACTARVAGQARMEIAFPERPVVAGIVPLPMDTLIKGLVGVLERKRPGAITSREEATLTVDLPALGLPPVEVNLRELRIEDGVLEVVCRAEEFTPVDAPRPELVEDPDDLPEPEPEEEDEDADDEAEEEVPRKGLGSIVRELFGPGDDALENALRESREARDRGRVSEARRILEVVEDEADPGLENGARVQEELAALRLGTGHREDRRRATVALERVLERDPSRPRATFLRARIHLLEGDTDLAEERARIAVGLDPFREESYRLLEDLLRERGASRACERARTARELLRALPEGATPGAAPEPRGILHGKGFLGLENPTEHSPVGALPRALVGSLAWLDPDPDPQPAGERTWPVGEDEYPRLVRLVRDIAEALQVEAPQLVLRRGEDAGPFRSRGVLRPWLEAGEGTVPVLGERALAFEVARSLHHHRSGRGLFLRAREPEIELLYALLRAVGQEAAQREAAERGIGPKGMERIVQDMVDSVAHGWVLQGRDLDPWIGRSTRAGVRPEALTFHAQSPSYRDLLTWRRSLAASADRTGLLFAGDLRAAVEALRLVESDLWEEASRDGLLAFRGREEESELAYRVRELLEFAVDPKLEELELAILS